MSQTIESRQQVRTYLSPPQINILKAKAKERNLTLSEYLRNYIIDNLILPSN